MVCLLSVCLALASCGMQGRNEKEIQTSDKAVVRNSEVTAKDHVEVLYFHGKQRCATCIAIENNTLAVMKENLSEQVKKGEVVFKVIDISKKENEKIAENMRLPGRHCLWCAIKWTGDSGKYDSVCFRKCP